MKRMFIDLKKGQLVEDFVETLQKLDGQFRLITEHAILDATSILGIYCLNLSEPVLLEIEPATEETMASLAPFMRD